MGAHLIDGEFLGEVWDVPRGFGATYRRVAKEQLARLAAGELGEMLSEVIDLLGLVGYQAAVDQVTGWDLRRRVEAVVYASTGWG